MTCVLPLHSPPIKYAAAAFAGAASNPIPQPKTALADNTIQQHHHHHQPPASPHHQPPPLLTTASTVGSADTTHRNSAKLPQLQTTLSDINAITITTTATQTITTVSATANPAFAAPFTHHFHSPSLPILPYHEGQSKPPKARPPTPTLFSTTNQTSQSRNCRNRSRQHPAAAETAITFLTSDITNITDTTHILATKDTAGTADNTNSR